MAADWVTQGLQETGFIDVVDSRTVLQASQNVSGGSPVVEALAKQTGAAIVVWGSYYVEGDSLIVRAHIVNAADGKDLREVSVHRVPRHSPSAALDILRDQVLAALAPLVDPRLATWEASLKPPTYAAYRIYVDGLENYVSQHNDLAYDSTAAEFARAVKLDTTFQTARLWQAFTLFLAGWTGNPSHLRTTDSVITVLNAHRDDLSPYDRRFYDWFLALRRSDIEGTYNTAKEMMNASPGSAHAIWESALAALRTNRPREALALLESPQLVGGPKGALYMKGYPGWKAAALHLAGDYRTELKLAQTYGMKEEEARAYAGLGDATAALKIVEQFGETARTASGWQAQLGIRLSEELSGHGSRAAARDLATRTLAAFESRPAALRATLENRVNIATLLYDTGRFRETAEILKFASAMDSSEFPDVRIELFTKGLLATAIARSGNRALAQQMSSDLERRLIDVAFRPSRSYWRARIAAACGDNASAVSLMRRAIAEGFLPSPSPNGRFLHADPDLAPLLSLPDLQEMTRLKD